MTASTAGQPVLRHLPLPERPSGRAIDAYPARGAHCLRDALQPLTAAIGLVDGRAAASKALAHPERTHRGPPQPTAPMLAPEAGAPRRPDSDPPARAGTRR